MADDPISSAAAHLAVLENETQHPHQPNEVDHMAESIERRVSGAVNTLSAWWQGMHDQVRRTPHTGTHDAGPSERAGRRSG